MADSAIIAYAVKTCLSNYHTDKDLKSTSELWEKQFKNTPNETFINAIQSILSKEEYFPTIATINKYIESGNPKKTEDIGKLWNDYTLALSKAGYLTGFLKFTDDFTDNNGNYSAISKSELTKIEIEKIYYSLPESVQLYFGDSSFFLERAKGTRPDDREYREFVKEIPSYIQQSKVNFLQKPRPESFSNADEVKRLQAAFDNGEIV